MSKYPFETHDAHAPGTVLMIRFMGGLKHYGIATGYGTVIHASRRFGKVDETSFDAFCNGARPSIVPVSLPKGGINGAHIVARARLRKGQRYNVLVNNCEHFITWVLEGKGRSSQLGPLDGRRLSRD